MSIYSYRKNQESIYASFERSFVTALLGSRRVGKSTLVEHYIGQHQERPWVCLNMDDRNMRQRIEEDGLSVVVEEHLKRKLSSLQEKVWVCIDEAQKCPELFDQIKLLYDQYKGDEAIKFILTGSGYLSLHQLSAESLAGRIELFHLYEFNLQESLLLQNEVDLPQGSLLEIVCDEKDLDKAKQYIEALSPLKPMLKQSLEQQLLWGGLPEVVMAEQAEAKQQYLSGYLQTYLEKDVRDIGTITNLALYQNLMEIVAEQTGSVRQDNALIQALGCTRDSLKKYRGFLQATLMYDEIAPFIGSSIKRLIKSPKGYLLSNGLISYLTGLDSLKTLEMSGLIGHRFENWVLKELQVWLARSVKRNRVHYWRTSTGVEVDFVVEKKPTVIPFETTYSSQPKRNKIAGVAKFMREEKIDLGFCIYMGDFKYDSENNICYLPAWALG